MSSEEWKLVGILLIAGAAIVQMIVQTILYLQKKKEEA